MISKKEVTDFPNEKISYTCPKNLNFLNEKNVFTITEKSNVCLHLSEIYFAYNCREKSKHFI